jgi:hypothetical protein
MRYTATRIENLDRMHPGLRVDVDLMFDNQATLEAVAAMLEEKYKQTVSIKTISNYKQRRYLPAKLGVEKLRDLFRGVKESFGEQAIPESTQAVILEKLQEALGAGRTLDPHFLLREQRMWAQHDAKVAQIENDKKRVELELAKADRARQEVERVMKEPDAQKDPQRALEQIRGIYGLGS